MCVDEYIYIYIYRNERYVLSPYFIWQRLRTPTPVVDRGAGFCRCFCEPWRRPKGDAVGGWPLGILKWKSKTIWACIFIYWIVMCIYIYRHVSIYIYMICVYICIYVSVYIYNYIILYIYVYCIYIFLYIYTYMMHCRIYTYILYIH